jgi:hypothetical protein
MKNSPYRTLYPHRVFTETRGTRDLYLSDFNGVFRAAYARALFTFVPCKLIMDMPVHVPDGLYDMSRVSLEVPPTRGAEIVLSEKAFFYNGMDT